MRLALVVPENVTVLEKRTRRSIKLSGTCAPLNLACLASYVRMKRPDVDVKIIDGCLGIDVPSEIFNFQPDIVGVTATTPLAPSAYMLGDLLGKLRPDIYKVIGGVHASAMPEEALQYFDCVVVGAGEKMLLDIIEAFEHDKPIRGIVHGEPLANLDDAPMPAYELLDMKAYLANSSVPGLTDPVMLMVTSRGCIYECPFCHNSNRKYPPVWLSAERVVAEFEYLIGHYGVTSFFFSDDEFLINKKRLKEIARLMKERGIRITWGCQARANTLTLETLELAKSMGCRLVVPGFESMSPRILDYLKCGTTTPEANDRAARLAEKVGIPVGANFIFGTPTETLQEMKVTYDWFLRRGGLKFANFMSLIPFPGTPVYKMCKRKGLLPEKIDYTRFTMTNRVYDTYIIDKAVTAKEYDHFLIHAQRVAWVLARLRLGTKLKTLLSDMHFWYVLVYHPVKLLRMLRCRLKYEPIVC